MRNGTSMLVYGGERPICEYETTIYISDRPTPPVHPLLAYGLTYGHHHNALYDYDTAVDSKNEVDVDPAGSPYTWLHGTFEKGVAKKAYCIGSPIWTSCWTC